jgi:hypothetical protein
LITASGAGLAAATLAILFGFAGPAAAQGSSGSGNETTTSVTTATTVFTGATTAAENLANTGADTWLLVTGAGVATAGAVAARKLLRSQTS